VITKYDPLRGQVLNDTGDRSHMHEHMKHHQSTRTIFYGLVVMAKAFHFNRNDCSLNTVARIAIKKNPTLTCAKLELNHFHPSYSLCPAKSVHFGLSQSNYLELTKFIMKITKFYNAKLVCHNESNETC
jgi:hypothetical protein